MATPSGERATLGWDEVRALYPGTADVAYLDSAAVGLISTRVRDAMTAMLTDHQQRGSAASPKWREHAVHVRASVARLVGGRVGQVALTQNTSTGLATVTNGLDWRAVQYSSGHRYDLGALGQVCQDSDVLLVVDGTQAVGAVTVDVEFLGVDVLAVSAHKWMLGPRGIGFIHLSQRAMQRLVPSAVGWLSVENPFAFEHEPVLAGDGRRFESGGVRPGGQPAARR